jgi:NADPH-dependent ferric siderophore reductase
MTQRNFVTHPIVLRRLEVARVVDVTPRMRRVTLVGEQLAAFTRDGLALPAFVSAGFDDHVKLVFASHGDIATALPVQLAQTIDWPASSNREMRDYTPRRFDAASGELDLDFVRHGDGPAARWAETAVVGDELHIAGPKSSVVIPTAVDWVLLVGDETALPAIGRYLDELPLDVPVRVIVEIRHPDARQSLALRAGDSVRWVLNIEADPAALGIAVREQEWLPGQVYVWAAAESSALLPLRRWLGREKLVPKTHLNVTGYWHQAQAQASDAGSPATGSPTAADAAERIGEEPARAIDAETLLSPVPWLAARAASELGLLDAVADSPRSPVALADALGLQPAALTTVVTYLASVGIFSHDGEAAHAVRLGPVGLQLVGDDHLRESIDDTSEARALVALTELAPALRGGESAHSRCYGQSLLDALNSDPSLFDDQLEATIGFDFIVRGAAELDVLATARAGTARPGTARPGTARPGVVQSDTALHVAVTGAGSLAFVEAFAQTHRCTIVERPVPLGVLREAVSAPGVEFAEEFPTADLAISALALGYRSDAEARALLAELRSAGDRALVIEEVEGPGLDAEHLAEHRLLELGASGVAMRTAGDIVTLAAASGWRVVAHRTLGWNYEAFELLTT